MSGNISSAQIEEIRWASVDQTDSRGRVNKNEPNPDQKDSGLLAGVSINRQNYNYMFDKYHSMFEQLRTHIEQLTLQANSTNIDVIYPVGSVYLTLATDSPATTFGVGTWEKLENRFLVGAGSSFPLNTTGGSSTHTHEDDFAVQDHTLTVDEIPAHSHTAYVEDSRGSGRDGAKDGVSGLQQVETNEVGGGQAHGHEFTGGISSASNLPPYLSVNIWKRVA